QSTDREENVPLEIEYDFEKINSIILTSVAHVNEHRDEDEVLFDFNVIF
ncbi:unnamed protein product, partial [Rotaria sordida]